MPCVFCRDHTHTKTTCTDPNTVAIQRSVMEIVTTTYGASLTRFLTRQEFIEANAIILDRKYTVIDLKKAFVYLKNRVETRFTDAANKKDLIRIIVLLSIQLFNYTFSSLEHLQEHTLNEYRLTTGITQVVREVLHQRVGGLHLPTNTQAPTRRPENEAVVPTPQYRLVIRAPFQAPRPAVPTPLQAAQMNQANAVRPPPPPPPTYTVYRTERACRESAECAICYDDLTNTTYVYLNCSHEFCKTCIKDCIRTKFLKCSLCRADITEIHTQEPVVTYSI